MLKISLAKLFLLTCSYYGRIGKEGLQDGKSLPVQVNKEIGTYNVYQIADADGLRKCSLVFYFSFFFSIAGHHLIK